MYTKKNQKKSLRHINHLNCKACLPDDVGCHVYPEHSDSLSSNPPPNSLLKSCMIRNVATPTRGCRNERFPQCKLKPLTICAQDNKNSPNWIFPVVPTKGNPRPFPPKQQSKKISCKCECAELLFHNAVVITWKFLG
jgi:hypothetical protein